jgi:hypothetical protein
MNRANSQSCYKCRAPKEAATLATVSDRQPGVVLTPGLDEEHREVAWMLMARQGYTSAWKLGYVSAGLLIATLVAYAVVGAMTLVTGISIALGSAISADSPASVPVVRLLAVSSSLAGLIAIVTVVVHSVFLYLTSVNMPALGSGSPRFDPIRAAVWWIESALWAIRGGLAFVVPPFFAVLATAMLGIFGLIAGFVWFMCAFWLLGDPVAALGKPKRLLQDMWERLGVPGSADARQVTFWSVAWGLGRGIEYAVAGGVYLLVIVLMLIEFVVRLSGNVLAVAPAGQWLLVGTLVGIAVLVIQVAADAVALFLLARITVEIASRQRVREGWVAGGLDMAAARARADAELRDVASREAAGAGVAPWVPQSITPWAPPEPVVDGSPDEVVAPKPRPGPVGEPPTAPQSQAWQGTAQWPPATKPVPPAAAPAAFRAQPPEVHQLQSNRQWPAAQPPVADAPPDPAVSDQRAVIRPSSAGTGRYVSARPAAPEAAPVPEAAPEAVDFPDLGGGI